MTEVQTETCDECGFDADDWNTTDTIKTIELASDLLRTWSSSVVEAGVENVRLADDVWSVAEYVDHVRETLFGMRFVIDMALGSDGVDAGPIPAESEAGLQVHFDIDEALGGVAGESKLLRDQLLALADDDWDKAIVLDGERHSVTWASRHAVHDLWHHLTDIAEITTELEAAPGTQQGTLEQISVSGGGVPKTAVDSADVAIRGVVGDTQATRVHHGRPWQALCLYSADVIDELAQEGHPIFAGAVGENLTIRGVDWGELHGGAVVEIGTVVCQLSSPAVPCFKNNEWFTNGDIGRMDHDLNPGYSRWYASVLQPGTVSTGDVVTVRPA